MPAILIAFWTWIVAILAWLGTALFWLFVMAGIYLWFKEDAEEKNRWEEHIKTWTEKQCFAYANYKGNPDASDWKRAMAYHQGKKLKFQRQFYRNKK